MVKFCFKVLIFSLLIVTVIKVAKYLIPYHWGNKIISQKLTYLEESKIRFNTFFIGSSTTYRHIIPQQIDNQELGIKSFNLGCPGMFKLESDYIAEKFINSYNKNYPIKIFFNENVDKPLAEKNLHSIRSKYFVDLKRFRKAMQIYAPNKNWKQIYYYALSYIENFLGIGELFSIMDFIFRKKHELPPNIQNQSGYLSLEEEPINKKKHLKNNRRFKSGTSKLNVKASKSEFKIKLIPCPMERNNVKCYSISGNPIDSNFYYFDRAHLNKEGAILYSKLLLKSLKFYLYNGKKN